MYVEAENIGFELSGRMEKGCLDEEITKGSKDSS